MAASEAYYDHNKVLRGKCGKCTCIHYVVKFGSNVCGECSHPAAVHEVKSGCSGGGECTCACKKYVHVHNTNDCYTCGHLPREHVGLGRVSMSEGTGDTKKTTVYMPKTYSEMKEFNKRKRMEFIAGTVPKKSRKRPNSAMFRRTIKVQLKRLQFTNNGNKKYVSVGDQRQITLNSTTTIENVLKACAEEFLNIPKDKYDEEVKEKNLDLILLDGKAIVKDPSFTFNRTSFNFLHVEKNEQSLSSMQNTSNSSSSQSSETSKNSEQALSEVGTSQLKSSGNVSLSKEDVLRCGISIIPQKLDGLMNTGEIFQISTFFVESKSWKILGYMRLEVSEEEFGKGGMRIARQATVLEGLRHDLLKTFPKGTNVLLKQYND